MPSEAGGVPTSLRTRRRGRAGELSSGDRVLRATSGVAAVIPGGLLGFVAVIMVITAIPAILFSGTNFFTGRVFSLGNLYATDTVTHNGVTGPIGAVYGALPLIVGTMATSLIALVLALPVSVGGVLMLTEWIPRRLQNALSVFLELLAGIPSVVFGVWGITVFGPWAAAHIYPAITRIGVLIPWLKGPVGTGQGLLTAGLVLAVMIIPIIASTTRELVRQVPVLAREGALALGMTRYEVVRVVTLPYIRTGIVAASLLGWGRALGETIAVLLISGNALNILPQNIFAPASTLASTIAAILDGALTDFTGLGVHALAEAGLLLLIISLLTNLAGRLVVRRVAGGALPVGRGF